MVAWMLEDMLSQLGCAVVGPAARVDQALALIHAGDLDAAVLDVNLNCEQSDVDGPYKPRNRGIVEGAQGLSCRGCPLFG